MVGLGLPWTVVNLLHAGPVRLQGHHKIIVLVFLELAVLALLLVCLLGPVVLSGDPKARLTKPKGIVFMVSFVAAVGFYVCHVYL